VLLSQVQLNSEVNSDLFVKNGRSHEREQI